MLQNHRLNVPPQFDRNKVSFLCELQLDDIHFIEKEEVITNNMKHYIKLDLHHAAEIQIKNPFVEEVD